MDICETKNKYLNLEEEKKVIRRRRRRRVKCINHVNKLVQVKNRGEESFYVYKRNKQTLKYSICSCNSYYINKKRIACNASAEQASDPGRPEFGQHFGEHAKNETVRGHRVDDARQRKHGRVQTCS